jgi:hypothetical protein
MAVGWSGHSKSKCITARFRVDISTVGADGLVRTLTTRDGEVLKISEFNGYSIMIRTIGE